MSSIQYYDKNAKAFVESSINADMTEHYSRFEHYLCPNSSILDLGCGSGRDTAFFREKGYYVVPIDGSKEICTLAEEYLGSPVLCMTFDQLNYSEEFDAVWACASLLHVRKAELPEIMDKVREALKPSGILYASFKYGEDEVTKNGRFFSNYTEHSVIEIMAKDVWTIEDEWISSDVRPGREAERWINIIAKKK